MLRGVGRSFERGIVKHNGYAIGRMVIVQLDHVDAERRGRQERRERVLRRDETIAAMGNRKHAGLC